MLQLFPKRMVRFVRSKTYNVRADLTVLKSDEIWFLKYGGGLYYIETIRLEKRKLILAIKTSFSIWVEQNAQICVFFISSHTCVD